MNQASLRKLILQSALQQRVRQRIAAIEASKRADAMVAELRARMEEIRVDPSKDTCDCPACTLRRAIEKSRAERGDVPPTPQRH